MEFLKVIIFIFATKNFIKLKPFAMNNLTSAVCIASPDAESQLLAYLKNVSSIEVSLIIKNNMELVEKMPQKNIDILFVSEDYWKSMSSVNLPPFVVLVAKSEPVGQRKFYFDVLTLPIAEQNFCDVLGKIIKIANAYQPRTPISPLAMEVKPEYHSNEHEDNDQYMFIKIGKISHKLVFDNILYIKNVGNSLQISMESGQTYFYRSTLKKFYERLPDNRFVRVNKSIVANFTKINRLHNQIIWLQNEKFSVSRIYIVRLRELLRLKKA